MDSWIAFPEAPVAQQPCETERAPADFGEGDDRAVRLMDGRPVALRLEKIEESGSYVHRV